MNNEKITEEEFKPKNMFEAFWFLIWEDESHEGLQRDEAIKLAKEKFPLLMKKVSYERAYKAYEKAFKEMDDMLSNIKGQVVEELKKDNLSNGKGIKNE